MGKISESLRQDFSEEDAGSFSGYVSRIVKRFLPPAGPQPQRFFLARGQSYISSAHLSLKGREGAQGMPSQETLDLSQPGDLLSKTQVDVT